MLVSGFWLPEVQDHTSVWGKPPSVRDFVPAVLGDAYHIQAVVSCGLFREPSRTHTPACDIVCLAEFLKMIRLRNMLPEELDR